MVKCNELCSKRETSKRTISDAMLIQARKTSAAAVANARLLRYALACAWLRLCNTPCEKNTETFVSKHLPVNKVKDGVAEAIDACLLCMDSRMASVSSDAGVCTTAEATTQEKGMPPFTKNSWGELFEGREPLLDNLLKKMSDVLESKWEADYKVATQYEFEISHPSCDSFTRKTKNIEINRSMLCAWIDKLAVAYRDSKMRAAADLYAKNIMETGRWGTAHAFCEATIDELVALAKLSYKHASRIWCNLDGGRRSNGHLLGRPDFVITLDACYKSTSVFTLKTLNVLVDKVEGVLNGALGLDTTQYDKKKGVLKNAVMRIDRARGRVKKMLRKISVLHESLRNSERLTVLIRRMHCHKDERVRLAAAQQVRALKKRLKACCRLRETGEACRHLSKDLLGLIVPSKHRLPRLFLQGKHAQTV